MRRYVHTILYLIRNYVPGGSTYIEAVPRSAPGNGSLGVWRPIDTLAIFQIPNPITCR